MSKQKFCQLVLNSKDDHSEGDSSTGVATAKPELKKELERPSRYHVVLLNDDFTPMDFVVDVLKIFFGMTEERAMQVMLTVHTQGKAVCGTYSKDVADTKAYEVCVFSKEHEHPLLCVVEKE